MRTAGRGSIHPLEEKPRNRCRKWQLRVSVGKHGGKYRTKTRNVTGTMSDAKRELSAFVMELEQGGWIDRQECPRLTECADEWLAYRGKVEGIAPKSLGRIRQAVRAAEHALGDRQVCDYTKDDAQAFVMSMIDGDTLSGNPLRPSTIRMYLVDLCSMWKRWAIPKGYASDNIWRGVGKPKVQKDEPRFLSEDEYGALCGHISESAHQYAAGLALALMAGLRRSECVVARWSDYDGARLHVRGTKNDASDATVPLMSSLVAYLDNAQENDVTGSDYIVHDAIGAPIKAGTLWSYWNRERVGLGLEDVRFHDLRHSFVSHLIRSGVTPKAVQKLARHATFAVTMDVYAHLNTDDIAAEIAGL